MRYLFKIIFILISKLLISQPMINIIGNVAMWTCSPYITEDEIIIYVNPCCNPYIVNIYEN
jgi:hypothetical protein